MELYLFTVIFWGMGEGGSQYPAILKKKIIKIYNFQSNIKTNVRIRYESLVKKHFITYPEWLDKLFYFYFSRQILIRNM